MISVPRSVGVIGAGNMGEAILRGLLQAGFDAGQLIASDPDRVRREQIASQLGIRTTASNSEVTAFAEVVILAIKPPIAITSNMVIRPFARPAPSRTIALVWRRSSPLGELMHNLAECLSDLPEELLRA